MQEREARTSATVRFSLKGFDLKRFHGLYTENISQGGVFVRCAVPLAIGTQVQFEIGLEGEAAPIVGEAEVVWVRTASSATEPAGMGLRFASLDSSSQAKITDFLANPTAVVFPEPGPSGSELLELEEPLELEELVEVSGAELPMAAELEEAAESTQVHQVILPNADSSAASESDAAGKSMVALPTSFNVLDTVLGIDLGTSNSCVAIIRDGKPFVIPVFKEERTLPSVVSYLKSGEIIVGKPAKEQLTVEPKYTIYGAKRFIGRPFNSPVVSNLKDTFPYEVVAGEKGQVAIQVRDNVVNLEEVSSHILSYLKTVAQEFIGLEVTKAIVTVPAYYNDNQRQAVKEAGRMAGLDIQRIVNEPTSAALAYGFNKGLKTKILIYDLGGGTFDVSVLELTGNQFEVAACGGNNFLGGEDFDNAITDFIVTTYEKEMKVELAKSRIMRERIKQGAEYAKRALSDTEKTTINVPYLKTVDNKTLNLQMNFSRETLNRVTLHLVKKTLQICDEVLNGVGISKASLDAIILVGGQTRMPLVRNSVHQHFGKTPRFDINPDEVVAMGAALLGAGMRQTDALKLRDTISISIGIALPGGRFKAIIKSNTPVPVTRTYKIGAGKATQDSFHIDVFQGESNFVHENEYLGTLLFSDLPVGKGEDAMMQIDFQVTEECILKVVATHMESGKQEEALLVTYDTPPSLKEAVVASTSPV